MKSNLICILLSLLFSFSLAAQQLSDTEVKIQELGFVDIRKKDPSIVVDMMYAKADNFVGVVMYKDLHTAYLHPLAASSLIKAHQELKRRCPKCRFIVYDATRPMSVQQTMWNKVKGTAKAKYVSNPANGGGLHNYGMAVDISILGGSGKPLSMGTKVDHLGYEAHIDQEKELVVKGIITEQERKNRLLLREVMTHGGFKPLKSEWWHFNRIYRAEARKNYKVVP
ncbi:M15 family metallopeptidase [Bacteroides propionicifaciens]|uniref:M15 family metallopeptidase n=1 Tax=Bacteroides propionicifaciens TaxID=392838 RepID=UPI0003762371|nr:M15 family metallopeptidase [Bacteroides propionicifaciens]